MSRSGAPTWSAELTTKSVQQRLDRPNPIAGYENWPAVVRSAGPYIGVDSATTALGQVLGLRRSGLRPTVHDEGSRRLDGIQIRRLRWSVGYGPDTTAWLLSPTGVRGSLPGVLGLHCHGRPFCWR